jgi:hypothetical protein
MIIECKPFAEMTLRELSREYFKWVEATRPGAWGYHYENAHITRDLLATWIDRRKRETKGGPHEINTECRE